MHLKICWASIRGALQDNGLEALNISIAIDMEWFS